jgi:hypothetical protein
MTFSDRDEERPGRDEKRPGRDEKRPGRDEERPGRDEKRPGRDGRGAAVESAMKQEAARKKEAVRLAQLQKQILNQQLLREESTSGYGFTINLCFFVLLNSVLMPIRIRLSILMPIQIRIRIPSFTHVGKSELEKIFFNLSSGSLHCFYLSRSRCHNFQYFGQHTAISYKKV